MAVCACEGWRQVDPGRWLASQSGSPRLRFKFSEGSCLKFEKSCLFCVYKHSACMHVGLPLACLVPEEAEGRSGPPGDLQAILSH